MIKCFGVGTSYLVIVGDLLPDALSNMGLVGMTRQEGVLCGFLVAGPLAYLKNLSALRYTALGSVFIAVWTSLLIVLFCTVRSSTLEPCGGLDQALPCYKAEYVPVGGDWLEIMRSLPVFIFGFTCQQNIFTVVNEVHDTTRLRVDLMIIPAYTIAALLFGAAAVAGYMTYGDLVDHDVLAGYPKITLVTISRLLFTLLVMFSYPMQAHPSRLSALALMHKIMPQHHHDGNHAAATASARVRFWAITTIWVSCSLTIALLVSNLGTILSIVGATGSTTVTYILPGLLYMRSHKTRHLKRYLAMMQLCAGCIIMPLCLTVIFV